MLKFLHWILISGARPTTVWRQSSTTGSPTRFPPISGRRRRTSAFVIYFVTWQPVESHGYVLPAVLRKGEQKWFERSFDRAGTGGGLWASWRWNPADGSHAVSVDFFMLSYVDDAGVVSNDDCVRNQLRLSITIGHVTRTCKFVFINQFFRYCVRFVKIMFLWNSTVLVHPWCNC